MSVILERYKRKRLRKRLNSERIKLLFALADVKKQLKMLDKLDKLNKGEIKR